MASGSQKSTQKTEIGSEKRQKSSEKNGHLYVVEKKDKKE